MMMRINLLPSRQVKTRRGQQSQQFLYLAAALLLATAIGNYGWYNSKQKTSQALSVRTANLTRQIEEKKSILKEVESINKRRAEVDKKLAVLNALRAAKSGPVRMMDALSRSTVEKVWISSFAQDTKGVTVSGSALTNEDVAEFMRGLGNVVWTPKGMGRLVEQRHGATTSRVELLAVEGGVIEEFPVAEIKPFFRGIDLKKSEAKDSKEPAGVNRYVDFQLSMLANYGA